MTLRAFGHSDTGRQRQSNEDHYVCLQAGEAPEVLHVFAVADGMGGHAGGQVASGLAVEALETEVAGYDSGLPQSLLKASFEAANRSILKKAAEDPALTDMGTTMVAAALIGPAVTLANLGDSRAYLARNGLIGQITVDHSWKEEARQHDLPIDEISMSPFRETITRSLGIDDSVGVDLFSFDLRPGDCILLCSDGVHDLLSDRQILATIQIGGTPEETSRQLVDMANDAGGHDNSTCVLIRWDGPAADPRVGTAVETGVPGG